jgi:hypothetical protein
MKSTECRLKNESALQLHFKPSAAAAKLLDGCRHQAQPPTATREQKRPKLDMEGCSSGKSLFVAGNLVVLQKQHRTSSLDSTADGNQVLFSYSILDLTSAGRLYLGDVEFEDGADRSTQRMQCAVKTAEGLSVVFDDEAGGKREKSGIDASAAIGASGATKTRKIGSISIERALDCFPKKFKEASRSNESCSSKFTVKFEGTLHPSQTLARIGGQLCLFDCHSMSLARLDSASDTFHLSPNETPLQYKNAEVAENIL